MTPHPVNQQLSALSRDYFNHRHARGYQLHEEEQHVRRFLDHLWLSGNQTTAFTTCEVLTWVHGDGSRKPSYQAQLLSSIRGYTKYCRSRGYDLPLLDDDAPPGARSRRVPHIYTQDEIDALLAACPTVFTHPHVATTMATIITLLAATGLRTGEAVRVETQDLDPDARTLLVRANKGGPQRLIPVHPTTIEALRAYAASPPRRRLTTSTGGPLFLSFRRTPHQTSTIQGHFARIREAADFTWQGATPTLRDLRHTFATRVMIRAYTTDGANPANTLGLLANWLGHSDPAHTYWYIQAVPELLALAAHRGTGLTNKEL